MSLNNTFEVHPPKGPESGIRISCIEHGEEMEFQQGYRQVVFYCPLCDIELEVTLYDSSDWRELTERC